MRAGAGPGQGIARCIDGKRGRPGCDGGLLDEVKDRLDAQPGTVLADTGYCNERDLSELEARGIDGYVAPGCEGKRAAGHLAPESGRSG